MKKIGYLFVLTAYIIVGCAQPNDAVIDKLTIEKYILTEHYTTNIDVTSNNIFLLEENRGINFFSANGDTLLYHLYDLPDVQLYDPRFIAVSENRQKLFVSDVSIAPNSIAIFDITDLQSPEWLINITGNTSSIDYLRVFDNEDIGAEIYWTNTNELVYGYYDENWNPGNTFEFPEIEDTEYLEGFDVGSDYIVVAARQAGIKVISKDLTTLISSLDLIGEAQDVRIYDDHAVVTLRQEGFAIVDLRDEQNPELVTIEAAPEFLYTLEIENDYAAFSSHAGGILLYNISDITSPEFIGQVSKDNIGYTYKVTMKKDKIYAATRKGAYIIGIN